MNAATNCHVAVAVIHRHARTLPRSSRSQSGRWYLSFERDQLYISLIFRPNTDLTVVCPRILQRSEETDTPGFVQSKMIDIVIVAHLSIGDPCGKTSRLIVGGRNQMQAAARRRPECIA